MLWLMAPARADDKIENEKPLPEETDESRFDTMPFRSSKISPV